MPHLRNCSKELREKSSPTKLRRFANDRKRSVGRRRYSLFLKMARRLKRVGRWATYSNKQNSQNQGECQ
jgi:hypothetical protein